MEALKAEIVNVFEGQWQNFLDDAKKNLNDKKTDQPASVTQLSALVNAADTTTTILRIAQQVQTMAKVVGYASPRKPGSIFLLSEYFDEASGYAGKRGMDLVTQLKIDDFRTNYNDLTIAQEDVEKATQKFENETDKYAKYFSEKPGR